MNLDNKAGRAGSFSETQVMLQNHGSEDWSGHIIGWRPPWPALMKACFRMKLCDGTVCGRGVGVFTLSTIICLASDDGKSFCTPILRLASYVGK